MLLLHGPAESWRILQATGCTSRELSLSSNDFVRSTICGFQPDSGQVVSPMDVGNVTRAEITGLQLGQTYEFAVTAYDSAGRESAMSDGCIVDVKR